MASFISGNSFVYCINFAPVFPRRSSDVNKHYYDIITMLAAIAGLYHFNPVYSIDLFVQARMGGICTVAIIVSVCCTGFAFRNRVSFASTGRALVGTRLQERTSAFVFSLLCILPRIRTLPILTANFNRIELILTEYNQTSGL